MFGDKELGVLDFRSLGNALYPEHARAWAVCAAYFRSLGNALYPELALGHGNPDSYFRSLGNALYPEPRVSTIEQDHAF